MKKGFTLIELLAVIIVLAIIALVATPIVLDVIKDSRDSAAKDSAYGVLHSANYYYAEQYMKNNGVFTEYECSFNNKQGCDLLSISGDKPTSGSLLIDKDGKVNGKIQFDDYEFYICDSKVLESESSECSFIEYEKIYAINESGVITGFKMEENVSLLDFIIPTVNASNLTKEAEEYIKDGKITIPEYINSIEVTGIGCSAFTNYDINEITILSEKVITICEGSLPNELTKLKVKDGTESAYFNYNDIIEIIPSNKKTYTVTYDLNGGVGEIANQEKSQDIDLILTNSIPTKEGYVFLGWSTDKTSDKSEYSQGSTYTKNEDIKLYAIWVQPQGYINDIVVNLSGKTSGDGSVMSQNGIRYTGLNVNNYVYYNCSNDNDLSTCEKWRIIGAFKDVDASDTNKYYVKIIRQDSLGLMQWHNSNINTWTSSDLYNYLNTTYYNSFSNSAKRMLFNAKWRIGGYDQVDTTTTVMYGKEGGSTKIFNIGLPSVSDFGYSSSACYSNTILKNYHTDGCKSTNWMQITDAIDGVTYEWTMHPYTFQTRVYIINNTSGQSIGGSYATGNLNVRPTIYLDSNVYVLTGDGSAESPYVLGI